MRALAVLLVCLSLCGCATAMVVGTVAGAAVTTTAKVGAFAVKTTAKTAVGVGRLAYRGARALTKDDCAEDESCAEPQ